MNKKEKYKIVYQCAVDFLNKIIANNPRLNPGILKDHLLDQSPYEDINDVNKRLIVSLQNRQSMPKVIKFDEREKEMRIILCEYDPEKILNKYAKPEELLESFNKKFPIRNLDSPRNLWRIFSKGIISGSKFLATFRNKEEFDKFVKYFALNKYTKAALPMLLEKEIFGLGFPLSCDFLKELGYRDYPKPDQWLIEIFSSLGLSESSGYEVYKAIIEMSEVVREDAYTVDKIFWLIGSGDFYLVKIRVGKKSDEFIKLAKKSIDVHLHS